MLRLFLCNKNKIMKFLQRHTMVLRCFFLLIVMILGVFFFFVETASAQLAQSCYSEIERHA